MVWALCYLRERASGEITSGKRVGMENSGHEECVISALRVVTNEHQGRKPADTGGINSGYKGERVGVRVRVKVTIHVHGSPPRAHPVPDRGSGGSGAQPREFFFTILRPF